MSKFFNRGKEKAEAESVEAESPEAADTPETGEDTETLDQGDEPEDTKTAEDAEAANDDYAETAASIVEEANNAGAGHMAAGLIRNRESLESAQLKIGAASRIHDLCAVAGFPGFADKYIKAGWSVDDVRTDLMASQEAAKQKEDISSVQSEADSKQESDQSILQQVRNEQPIGL